MACIIRSGPQMNATALRPSQVARSNSWVTIPTRPSQSGPARSTVSLSSMSARGGQPPDLGDEQPVGRGPGPEVEPDRADRVAPGEAGVDERPERREPDPAGDDDDVVAGQSPRPASRDRADPAGRCVEPRSSSVIARVAGPRPGSSGRGRPVGSARRRSGAAEKAGRAAITNWPGFPASSRRSVVRRWRVTVSAVSRVVPSTWTVTNPPSAGARSSSMAGVADGDCMARRRRDGQLRHRDRAGAGDDRQLLADVDADRAPGDAPTAPDAAARPELVPPGRELVGQPLAVAVLGLAVGTSRRRPSRSRRRSTSPRSAPRSRSCRRGRIAGRRWCRSRSGRRACSWCRRGSARRPPPSPGCSGGAARPARDLRHVDRVAHRPARAGDRPRPRPRRRTGRPAAGRARR